MDSRYTRRELIEVAAAAGLGSLILPRRARAWSPNARLQHAAIGVGGMGGADLRQIAAHEGVEIVALCDVDLARAQAAAEKFPEARLYQDWRELFEKEGDRVDSVNITTPDHMHAAIALTALGAGKHVYCQKPMAHDFVEVRRMSEAAARAGVVTQMGVQLTSTLGERSAVQMIRDGVIGKIERVWLWSNKDPWKYRPTGPRPVEEAPPPETLDWDKWIGTAPLRPFVPEVYHPTFWRGWQDFGVGWLGDMGCHITDAAFRSLGLTAPLRVRGEAEAEWRDHPGRFGETWPTWQVVHYVFPGTPHTVGDTIEVTWSDGGRYPPDELWERFVAGEQGYPEQGALFLGEGGALLLPHGGEPSLHPAAEYAEHPRPELEPRDHYHHWVDACLGGPATEAGFEHSGPLTESILLGTIALRRPGQDLSWDAARLQFPDQPEANRLLRREYREGWRVEGL